MIFWMLKFAIKAFIIVAVIVGVLLYAQFGGTEEVVVVDNESAVVNENEVTTNQDLVNSSVGNTTVLGDSQGNSFKVWE